MIIILNNIPEPISPLSITGLLIGHLLAVNYRYVHVDYRYDRCVVV